MSRWVEILKEEYMVDYSIEWGYQIQTWLATQDTDDTGCPLIDSPFIMEIEFND
jgi:hypothetical protein